MAGIDWVALLDDAQAKWPEVGANGFRIDHPDDDGGVIELRDFLLAHLFLSSKRPESIESWRVATQAGRMFIDVLEGSPIGIGAIVLAGLALGYASYPTGSDASPWLTLRGPDASR